MAVKSIAQVKEYAENEKLTRVLESYDKKHRELDEEVAGMLAQYGKEEKEPAMMAEVGSWMGIQSVSEYVNKYHDASKESESVAKKLIKIEEDFMKEMKEFV